MADTDLNEWILLDTDLTTRLAILPVISSHLYLEINEPGSGELRLPLDSIAAWQITSGMFCQCFYRGQSRGGFFVDNLKEVQADDGEYGGRVMSVSGRGALALLEDAIIWDDGSGSTTRNWTGATKASILIDMIDEAKARGALANLTYDFTDTTDSDSETWTDSEDYKFNVGMSLLDLLREFAKTGIEFDINLTGGNFVLSAYKNGIGSNKSNSVFLRVGSNCLEVEDDYRGDELVNAMRVKYKDGYITVSDGASITNYRRREKLLSLEQAQSGTTASTYAAAKLDALKNPRLSIAVRVHDGVPPYLFLDYQMGDTITVDRLGAEVSYRVLGIQADFNTDGYSNVVLELNNILYENDLKVENDLNWMLNQWNTAKDGGQLEITYWQGLNMDDFVFNVVTDGTKIYIGGLFTKATGYGSMVGIGGYDTSTSTFFSVSTSGLPSYWGEYFDVREMCVVGTTLYVHVWDSTAKSDRIYKYAGGSWTEIGNTLYESGYASGRIYAMASDGTNLWVGGSFKGIDGVGIYNCAYWDGANWNSAAMASSIQVVYSLVYFNSTMYASRHSSATPGQYEVAEWNGSSWTTTALSVNDVGGQLPYFLRPYSSSQCIVIYRHNGLLDEVGLWDGSSATVTNLLAVGEGLLFATIHSAFAYLSDIYIFGDFHWSYSSGELFYNIARYSGGSWSSLEAGTNGTVYDGVVIDGNLYIGGDFTTAGGVNANYFAVRATTFDSAIRIASNSGFDLASAIHNAPASDVSDNDEFGFWEDVSQAIRKITWANIKSKLKTYLDTLYMALTGNQSVAGVKTLTDTLNTIPSSAGDTAIYAETSGDAYGIDLEQFTTDTSVSSSSLFLYRETSGTGNITAPMIEGVQAATGTGTITGRFIDLQNSTTSKFFRVDKDGNVNIPSGAAYQVNGVPLSSGGDMYKADNLSGLADYATARSNLGLVAGGAGDIWVEKAGDTMTGALTIQINDAVTNDVTVLAAMKHTSTGTTAVGFGGSFAFYLEASNGTLNKSGEFICTLTDAATGDAQMKIGVSGGGTIYYPLILYKTGISFNGYQAVNGDILLNITESGTPVFRITKNSSNGVFRVFQAYNQPAMVVSAGSSTTADLMRLLAYKNSAYVTVQSVDYNGIAFQQGLTTTTNAVLTVMKLQAGVSSSSTGGANGFGVGQSYFAETATDGTYQQQALIASSWIDATNATRKAKLSLSAYDTAARLGLEIEASGSAAKLGFYGVTPVARPTTAIAEAAFVENSGGTTVNVDSTFAGYTLQQIAQALKDIGILT